MPTPDTLQRYSTLQRLLNRTYNPFTLRSALATLRGVPADALPLESNANTLLKIRTLLPDLRDANDTDALDQVAAVLADHTIQVDRAPRHHPCLPQADVA